MHSEKSSRGVAFPVGRPIDWLSAVDMRSAARVGHESRRIDWLEFRSGPVARRVRRTERLWFWITMARTRPVRSALAGAPSSLPFALHSHRLILDHLGRALVRDPHRVTIVARHVSQHRRAGDGSETWRGNLWLRSSIFRFGPIRL